MASSLQLMASRLAEQREARLQAQQVEECRQLTTLDLTHLKHKQHAEVFTPDAGTSLLMRALSSDAATLRALRPAICVDIGCGAGAEAVHLTRSLPTNSAAVIATDINPHALLAARATSVRNGGQPLHLLRSHLLAGLRPGTVDVVVWHCPYVPTTPAQLEDAKARADLSCSYAGGPGGHMLLKETLGMLRTVLAPGGVMYLVCYRRTDQPSGKPKALSPSEGGASSGVPALRDRASARCISHWVSDELSGMGVLAHECAASCAETSHLCVLRCFVDESSTPPVHEQHVPVGAADPAAMGLACSALAGCDLTEDVD